MLLYGFKTRGPTDAISDSLLQVPRDKETKAYLESLAMHCKSARRAIARAQVKQSDTYNRGRKEIEFNEGDLVLVNPHLLEWVESKGEGAKLIQHWIRPFEVQQRINNNTYRLRLDESYPKSPVFNIQHLKKYQVSLEEFGERQMLDRTRLLPADEEYKVEKIVGHQYGKRKRTMTYLVRWTGYSPLYDLWRTTKQMQNAPEVLHEYKKRHKLR